MIDRISVFAISVMLSGMFAAPCYAQSASSTLNSGRSDSLLPFDRMIDGTNQTIAPGAARISGSLYQDTGDQARTTFAFNLHPTTLCSPAVSFLVHQNSGSSPVYISHLFTGDFEVDRSMEGLLPTQEVKTLFFTRTSVRLVQLWGGRLRLDGFMGTLNMQNVQLGPSAAGGLRDFHPPRESYPHGPRSIDLYGISVSIHLGRNAPTERPLQVRRCLSRIVGDVLG
jgi:hypothetical protein